MYIVVYASCPIYWLYWSIYEIKWPKSYLLKHSIRKAFIFGWAQLISIKWTSPILQNSKSTIACYKMQIFHWIMLETIQIVLKCLLDATSRPNIESIMNFIYIVFDWLIFFLSPYHSVFMIIIEQVYIQFIIEQIEKQWKQEKNWMRRKTEKKIRYSIQFFFSLADGKRIQKKV